MRMRIKIAVDIIAIQVIVPREGIHLKILHSNTQLNMDDTSANAKCIQNEP